MLRSRILVPTLLLALALPFSARAEQNSAGRKRALLVGCTRYDRLTPRRQLRGPANDVVLLRRMLIEQFEFQPADIVVLADADDAAKAERAQGLEPTLACASPTNEHICRAFEKLIETVQAGDQIFILLSGHGSRQCDADHDPQRDAEPDGTDELFLPCDIGAWKDAIGEVENSISDDRFREWIAALVGQGAFVFFVADACHSGTVTRGGEEEGDDYTERARDVTPAELGVPNCPEASATAGASSSPAGGDADWFDIAAASGGTSGVVALYAAQSHQQAIEARPSPSSPHFGRLSHVLYEVLSQAGQRITYSELAQRIQWRFEQNNWISRSTPDIEGTALDRTFLGMEEWPGRSQLTLHRSNAVLSVTAGALHGLTPGSILAVHPPVGAQNSDALLGYVRVQNVSPLSAVVEPVAWQDVSIAGELPDEGRCEIAFHEPDEHQLTVAVRSEGVGSNAAELLASVQQQLSAAANARGAACRLVSDGPADWIAVVVDAGVYLQRATSPLIDWSDAADIDRARRCGDLLGAPFPINKQSGFLLNLNLERIARADALCRLAEEPAAARDPSINITMEALQADVPLQSGAAAATLEPNDMVRLRIVNSGLEPVAVLVFYIDSVHGIELRFPKHQSDAQLNQIPVGGTLERQIRFQINKRTIGWEHVIVIAVGAKDHAAITELMRLQQESLNGGKSRSTEPLQSPLARLVNGALRGSRGDADPEAIPAPGSYAIRRVSWNVVARTPPVSASQP